MDQKMTDNEELRKLSEEQDKQEEEALKAQKDLDEANSEIKLKQMMAEQAKIDQKKNEGQSETV